MLTERAHFARIKAVFFKTFQIAWLSLFERIYLSILSTHKNVELTDTTSTEYHVDATMPSKLNTSKKECPSNVEVSCTDEEVCFVDEQYDIACTPHSFKDVIDISEDIL